VEDIASIDAGLPVHLGKRGSIAHQSSGLGIIAQRINRWNQVAHRKHGQLNAPAAEKSVTADEKGLDLLARERGEGPIDFGAGAGIEHTDLQPHRATRRLAALSTWPRRSQRSSD